MVASNGDIYVWAREEVTGAYYRLYYIKSVDDGENWGSVNIIFDFGDTHTLGYGSNVIALGTPDKIHRVFCDFDETLQKRLHVYHVYMNLADNHLYSMSGTDLGTSINKTEADSSCRIFDSGTNQTLPFTFDLDSNGYPHILFNTVTGVDEYTIKYVKWNGTSWTTPISVTTTGARADRNVIVVTSPSDIEAYLSVSSDTDYGGDMERWLYNGVTWAKDETIISEAESGSELNNPKRILNHHDNLTVVFSQFIYNDYSTPHKVYAYGDSGFLSRSLLNDEVSLLGHYTDFPNDITFTGSDGNTLLYHWLQENTSSYAIFWVKVEEDLSSVNRTIYIYYGKTGQSSGSNIDSTFIFGDEFSGASLNASKWDTVQGSIGVDGSGNLQVLGTTETRGLIEGKTNIPIGSALHTQAKANSNIKMSGMRWCSARGSGAWTDVVSLYSGSQYYVFRTLKATASTSTNVDLSTFDEWHEYHWEWQDTTDEAEIFQGTASKADHTTNIPTVNLETVFYEGVFAGHEILVDWVFARKFIDPEPQHGSWGSEEPGPGGEYDVVDNNTSNVDSHTDNGTHSDFTNEQDCNNSEYDTLTEVDTGGGGSNVTLINDGFEIGTDNWDGNGGPSGFTRVNQYTASGETINPHGDSWFMVAPESTGSQYLACDDLDMSTATAIYVFFWYYDDDLEPNEMYLSFWNGTQYNTIADLGSSSESQWNEYSQKVTDSTYFVSSFHIRIDVSTGNNEAGGIDDVLIIREVITTNYELDLEVQWTDANYTRTNEELCIYAGSFNTSEDLQVEVWHSSQWNWIMNLTASQWSNVSVSSYLDSATFTFRYLDGTATGDSERSAWNIDCALLHTWEAGILHIADLTQSLTSTWGILTETAFNVNPSQTISNTWDVLTDWDAVTDLSQSLSTSWNVLSQWDAIADLTQSLSTSWNVLSQWDAIADLTQSLSTSWNVLTESTFNVASSLSITTSWLVDVVHTIGGGIQHVADLTQSISTTWNILSQWGAIAVLTQSLTTSWNVLTEWNIIVGLSQSFSTTWSSLSITTSWLVDVIKGLQHFADLTQSISTTWEVLVEYTAAEPINVALILGAFATVMSIVALTFALTRRREPD